MCHAACGLKVTKYLIWRGFKISSRASVDNESVGHTKSDV